MRFLTFIKQYERLVRPMGQSVKKCIVMIDRRFGTSLGLRSEEPFVNKNAFKRKPKDKLLPESREASANASRFGGGSILLLCIPVISAGLGTWQIFRWRQKLEMVASLEAKTTSPPIPLFNALSEFDVGSLDYTRVKVRGKFDYTNEALIGPRTLDRKKLPKKGIANTITTNNGYHIITPFKVSGQNLILLVNRGWIPSYRQTNYKPIPESDEVEIVGLIRKNEKRPIFMGKSSGRTGLYLYRDVPTIAKLLGANEIFLDLGSVENVDLSQSLPIPAQTRVTLHNDHVSYIFTWYGLSLVTSYLWHRQFIKKLPLR